MLYMVVFNAHVLYYSIQQADPESSIAQVKQTIENDDGVAPATQVLTPP